jgi:hypothetical protein
MTNARPWGLQEIMSKFNSGYLRTVDIQKSFYETNKGDSTNLLENAIKNSAGSAGVSGTSSAGQSGTNATPALGGTSGVVATNFNSSAVQAGLPFLVAPQTQFLGPVSSNPNINPDKVTKVEDGKNSNKLEMNKDANLPPMKPIAYSSNVISAAGLVNTNNNN